MNLKLIQTDKEEAIKPFLPKESILDRLLKPKIEKLYPTFLKALKEEIEIYRAIPKAEIDDSDLPKRNVDEDESTWDEKTFDPRHPQTCFMGKAFKQKVGQTTSPLELYRKSVGTIQHEVWGNVTLLEIWGADHFKDYPKMVKSVFRYAYGLRKTFPRGVKFHINPMTPNEKTGKTFKTKEQREYDEYIEKLTAEALVYGVKTPAQARRDRRR